MKKYNDQTGGYKIDVYLDEVYLRSTDRHKTLKAAKARFLELNGDVDPDRVKCCFDRT